MKDLVLVFEELEDVVDYLLEDSRSYFVGLCFDYLCQLHDGHVLSVGVMVEGKLDELLYFIVQLFAHLEIGK